MGVGGRMNIRRRSSRREATGRRVLSLFSLLSRSRKRRATGAFRPSLSPTAYCACASRRYVPRGSVRYNLRRRVTTHEFVPTRIFSRREKSEKSEKRPTASETF
jgi:hypothetical protein